ncbi:MAG: glycogen synthase GlgA [Candidatus Omnitrophica bacterium]|nr:glycogen synthase GlgA [Candidatus Omnitrophota bacterium]
MLRLKDNSLSSSKKSLNVLFVSSEVAPYAKTGGLADVASALPKALMHRVANIRVIMPLYRCIRKSGYSLYKIAAGVTHPLLGNLPHFDVYANHQHGIETYFIEHRKYFDRDELYGTSRGDYPDNAVRFSFFSKAVLAFLKTRDISFDIIHCHDWQTALVPFYRRFKLDNDPFYQNMRVLYTVHNLAYQGQFHRWLLGRLDIPKKFFNMHALEFYRKINFMKSGILYADAVNTVSKGYAREILTEEYGCGLHGLLKARKEYLFGITNGADYSEWDPMIDPYIKEQYSIGSHKAKEDDKRDLLESVGLPAEEGLARPVIGVIARFAWQKGIDLLVDIIDDLVALGAQVVILGKGEAKYENLLRQCSRRHPRNVALIVQFNNSLAHKIEAGADIFLMPSRYEPCGLNQMYSLKYGTIPVVRATGGLDDVIIDYDEDAEQGNGFKFYSAEGRDFLHAVKRALNRYQDKLVWQALVSRAMQEDFSWDHAAREYVSLYDRIRS